MGETNTIDTCTCTKTNDAYISMYTCMLLIHKTLHEIGK